MVTDRWVSVDTVLSKAAFLTTNLDSKLIRSLLHQNLLLLLFDRSMVQISLLFNKIYVIACPHRVCVRVCVCARACVCETECVCAHTRTHTHTLTYTHGTALCAYNRIILFESYLRFSWEVVMFGWICNPFLWQFWNLHPCRLFGCVHFLFFLSFFLPCAYRT